MSRASVVQDVEWLMSGRVGVSSKAIWCYFNRQTPDRGWGWGYPLDPDDFSRCYLLLKRNPDWRKRVSEMAFCGKVWGALAEHWDELEQMFLDIFGGSFTEQDYDNSKPWDKAASARMYDRMKQIEKGAEAKVASNG